MTTPLHLRIDDGPRAVYSCELLLPMVVGRQAEAGEELFQQRQESGRARLVIARREEQTISRRHVLIDPQPDGRVRITNLSGNLTIRLLDGQELRPGTSAELAPPLGVLLGRKTIRVDPADTDSDSAALQSLPASTLPPGFARGSARLADLSATLAAAGQGDSKAILEWLEATVEVFQCAASSSDFFIKAAQAVVEMAELDTGHVLIRDGANWHAAADFIRPGLPPTADEWKPSRMVLDRICREKSPCWRAQIPPTAVTASSLYAVKAFVAAPILDRTGNVIGVLYGDGRGENRAAQVKPLTEIEAKLVELLARGVAAGLARMEQEKAVLAERVRFEQFFSTELAHQLTVQPDMLAGRDCEVTLLFSDVRRFAAISERLPTQKTLSWLSDVMSKLSEAVRAHGGVLVEYIGDELLAMWGAPQPQADQAVLACRAALDMLRAIPALNARWQAELGEPVSISIGVNTGVTCVGNTGTPFKFRYGPLGKTVNLASRVRGATKFLQCDVLITGSTFASLKGELPARRLCTARVVHMEQPVELFELVMPDRPRWLEQQHSYDEALRSFEAADFQGALQTLGLHLGKHPDDGPALVLLSRTIEQLLEKSAPFEPVWDLPGK
jgi:adenylate cyclase